MNVYRFWYAIVLIVLTSCVQKEDMTEVQEDICPFMIELDTLNALDVGVIYTWSTITNAFK